MSDHTTELDAYFARISYSGARTPTLATLRAIQPLHTSAIPFENIDVLLGKGIDLEPQAVAAKLLRDRRGGYCFEQNGLLRRVLVALGFDVQARLARVSWMLPPGTPPRPRTHMVLMVTIDGVQWLVDVGVGASVPLTPLLWTSPEPQQTPFGRYRIRADAHGRLVETDLTGDWSIMYYISDEPPAEADFIVANWYTATHPRSHFASNLMVSRSQPTSRASLLDNRLTVRAPDGTSRRDLLDRDGLASALATVFGLPVAADWMPLLERVALAPN